MLLQNVAGALKKNIHPKRPPPADLHFFLLKTDDRRKETRPNCQEAN